MRLKIATTISLLVGVTLLFMWPFVLGPKPGPEVAKKVLAQYAARSLIYFGITCFTFLITAVFAVLLMRRAREEFAAQALENLSTLVEGSLRSHGRVDHDGNATDAASD